MKNIIISSSSNNSKSISCNIVIFIAAATVVFVLSTRGVNVFLSCFGAFLESSLKEQYVARKPSV